MNKPNDPPIPTTGQRIAEEYYRTNELTKKRLAGLIDAATSQPTPESSLIDELEDFKKTAQHRYYHVPTAERCIAIARRHQAQTLQSTSPNFTIGDASTRKDEGAQHISEAVSSRPTSPANTQPGIESTLIERLELSRQHARPPHVAVPTAWHDGVAAGLSSAIAVVRECFKGEESIRKDEQRGSPDCLADGLSPSPTIYDHGDALYRKEGASAEKDGESQISGNLAPPSLTRYDQVDYALSLMGADAPEGTNRGGRPALSSGAAPTNQPGDVRSHYGSDAHMHEDMEAFNAAPGDAVPDAKIIKEKIEFGLATAGMALLEADRDGTDITPERITQLRVEYIHKFLKPYLSAVMPGDAALALRIKANIEALAGETRDYNGERMGIWRNASIDQVVQAALAAMPDTKALAGVREALRLTSQAYQGVGDFEGTGENMAACIDKVRAAIATLDAMIGGK